MSNEEIKYSPPYILYVDKQGRITPDSVKMLRYRFEIRKMNRSKIIKYYGLLECSAQFYNWIAGHRGVKKHLKKWSKALIDSGAIDEVKRI